ncbi:MAG: MerR family transcriptional regulator [Acidobacteriota bacterium]|jgi:DNA-binding transcriptional MerR regulator
MPQKLKIGDLARRAGISVRTLHHYEEIGLLQAAQRTGSGHRVYGGEELLRLQEILSLRRLGLSLEQVRKLLARPGSSPMEVLERYLAALQEQEAAIRELRARIAGVAQMLRRDDEISVDRLLELLDLMRTVEGYFTGEQRRELQERARVVGEDRIREVEEEWPRLIAAVRSEMEKGTDPACETVRALAARWDTLVREFTGSDVGLERTVATMYREQPRVRERMGLDGEIFEYITRARAATGSDR